MYQPPLHQSVTVHLTAECGGCGNIAQKDITVEACDICANGVGNPIQPATGEKEQTESDWTDTAAHGLSLTRYYRSRGMAGAAGLGSHWSHDGSVLLSRSSLEARLKLGDGRKILFRRDSPTAPWLADSGKDSLTDSNGGTLYSRASDDSQWFFDASGKLITLTQRNG